MLQAIAETTVHSQAGQQQVLNQFIQQHQTLA